MKDTARLPPELACQFIRTFKSGIPVRDMLGEEENGTIIAKVIFDSGLYELVRIDIPRYRFREEKAAKLRRILPILACPYCKKAPESDRGCLRCRDCGHDFPFTGNSHDFLTDGFKKEFSIVPTQNVSENGMVEAFSRTVSANPEKLFLDMGAGFKSTILSNLINFEIVDYPSTDILGVGESLPFLSDSLDGVYCDCVLEHVKDPFACAREIMRVLKPGGLLHCTVPFLQPMHAYPNHFYNMTEQGLVNLFQGMDLRESFVPDHLHPMASVSWILKSYLVWLPEKEKREFADLTILELLETFPMLGMNREHPIFKALPKDKWREIASGNSIIATKPGAACELNGPLGNPASSA
jgi:SAM-dependent methyltransferase